MAPITPTDLELGFTQLLTLARLNPALEKELAASVGEFFTQQDTPQELQVDGLLNARRHQEWFLFERHSPHLEGVPCERLLGEWRELVADKLEDCDRGERALLDSNAGIFTVLKFAEDGAACLEDLGCLQEHSLRPNPDAPPLETGDLIIGRLHPDGDGAVLASPAAGVFRNPELHGAITADLAQRRSSGGPTLLRFDQMALEKAFFQLTEESTQPDATPPDFDPLDDAEDFLNDAGLAGSVIQDTLARLRSTPLQPNALAVGVKDELAEILDDLAFDTDVDLTKARAVLAAAWHALRKETEALLTSPKDVNLALADFDRGKSAGRDVQGLLDDLERDLGLEDDSGETMDPPAIAHPDGVARPMVMEFRWEAQASKDIHLSQEQLDSLDLLIEFGSGFDQPEELGAQAIRQFLFFWCPEQRVQPKLIAALGPALAAFCDWAKQEQSLEVADWQGSGEDWLGDLQRILELNQSLPKAPESDGDLFEVIEAEDPKGLPGLLVSALGGVPFRTQSDIEALRSIQAGDLLRAKLLDEDRLEVRTIYPGSIRENPDA
ncbi:MAG: hypothetical protein OSB42_12105 [Planctomycetota bacterium]|nr:hypothetical protein [Planctomycetota bacterium]